MKNQQALKIRTENFCLKETFKIKVKKKNNEKEIVRNNKRINQISRCSDNPLSRAWTTFKV